MTHESHILSTVAKKLMVCLALGTMFWLTILPLSTQQSDVPGMALGNASLSTARGTDALMTNPANLTLSTAGAWFISSNFSVSAGTTAMDFSQFKHFFSAQGKDSRGQSLGRVVSIDERDQLITQLSGSTFNTSMTTMPLAVAVNLGRIGAIGFSLSSTVSLNGVFPSNLLSMLCSNCSGGTKSLSQANLSGIAYSSNNFTYSNKFYFGIGTDLEQWSVGVTAKKIKGTAMIELDKTNEFTYRPIAADGWSEIPNYETRVLYTIRSAGVDGAITASSLLGGGEESGAGWGMDIGVNYGIGGDSVRPGLLLSAVLQDVGSITWADAVEKTVDRRDTVSNIDQLDDSFLAKYQSKNSRNQITTALPTVLRLGAGINTQMLFNWYQNFNLGFTYTQGLNRVGANNLSPEFGLGVEMKNRGIVPTFRTGVNFQTLRGLNWTLGLGWRAGRSFGFDISLGSMTILTNRDKASWIDSGARIVLGF